MSRTKLVKNWCPVRQLDITPEVMLRDSLYRSIQLLICLKMEAYGDMWDRSNPFCWERVICNLPGTKGYQPTLPWAMKVWFDRHLACEVYVHVNGGWVTVHCREMC